MKSLINGLLLASVLAFTVGCGKDGGGSSSSGGAAGPVQNLYNSALNATSKAALDKVQAWYNGTTEGKILLNSKVNIIKTKYVSEPTSNCSNTDLWVLNLKTCLTSSSSSTGTVVGTLSNVLLTQNSAAIKNKGNQELNAVFSGANGQLISAIDTGPSVSQLVFRRTDGVIVTFTIDRNYHSAMNPVVKTESSQTSRIDTIVTAQIVY